MRAGTPLVRLLAGLGLALGLNAAAVTTASAHATLISSNPGNGVVLPVAPGQVLLQFDVPVNPHLSEADVRDRFGRHMRDLTVETSPGTSSVLAIDLPPLGQGVYRLVFEAWDDTDLHETQGTIGFGVAPAANV